MRAQLLVKAVYSQAMWNLLVILLRVKTMNRNEGRSWRKRREERRNIEAMLRRSFYNNLSQLPTHCYPGCTAAHSKRSPIMINIIPSRALAWICRGGKDINKKKDKHRITGIIFPPVFSGMVIVTLALEKACQRLLFCTFFAVIKYFTYKSNWSQQDRKAYSQKVQNEPALSFMKNLQINCENGMP